MRAYLYVVGAADNADTVRPSKVPFRIDDDEIFFGPCKKNLRELLRGEWLVGGANDARPSEDIYLVGINRSKFPTRKVIWAGKATRIMTFAVACDALSGPRYERMRTHEESPLHVRPIFGSGGRLLGYKHVSGLHEEDNKWVTDLCDPRQHHTRVEGRTVRLVPGTGASEVFTRDACLLLENLFFSTGEGIAVDDNLVDVLRRAQPGKADTVDSRAPFGRTRKGDANGKRGQWLELGDGDTKDLVAWVNRRSRATRTVPSYAPRQRPKC